MAHNHAGSSHENIGTLWSGRDGHEQQFSGKLKDSYNDYVVRGDPKHTKKISQTPVHHPQQPETLTQDRMGSHVYFVYATF